MDEYIGTVRLFAGNFVPRSWAECNGAKLSIAENKALFEVIGAQFGGDGKKTFALPDLRGRIPAAPSLGRKGARDFVQGDQVGEATHSLKANEMPQHSHGMMASNVSADMPAADGTNYLAQAGYLSDETQQFVPTHAYSSASPSIPLNDAMIGSEGVGKPHENRQPSLGSLFIICVEGLMPTKP